MELKEKTKYKKTELGLLPSDWEIISYGDAFDFLTTATYSRAELYENKEIKYIHYGDIHTKFDFFLDFTNCSLPSIENHQLKLYPTLKEGDIIMADASEDYEGVGKSVEIRNIHSTRAISGLHTFLLRAKKPTFINGFKAYIHVNRVVKGQLDKLATGMKVYGVSKNNLKSIKIPYPPSKKEQTAIATTLSDVDALITSLEKLIDKKKLIKEGTMQSLLKPKRHWQVIKFHKVCWFQEGPGLRNWQFKRQGIKVINVTNLENGILNLGRTDRHISLEEFHRMYEHFEIEEDDIVVASSGNSYGKVAVVRKQDLPLVMNTSVIRFKPLENLDYKFLLIFLKSKSFKTQIDLLITGGAQPNFGPAHLNKIDIVLPKDKLEQNKIASIITDMGEEISALENKIEKLNKMKQGMMQNLLTGKIRLI